MASQKEAIFFALDVAKTAFPLRVLTGADSMYPNSYPFIEGSIPAAARGTSYFRAWAQALRIAGNSGASYHAWKNRMSPSRSSCTNCGQDRAMLSTVGLITLKQGDRPSAPR